MMEHSVIGTSKVGCNFQKRMNELLLHQTEFINPRNHMQYPDHMFLLGKSQNWTLWLLMKEKGPRMWAAGAGMLSHFSSVCYCCSPHAHPSRFPPLNSRGRWSAPAAYVLRPFPFIRSHRVQCSRVPVFAAFSQMKYCVLT